MEGAWQNESIYGQKLYRVAGRVLWQRVVGEDRVPVLGVGLLDVQAALFQTSRGINIWMCPAKGLRAAAGRLHLRKSYVIAYN
jgi:hypothetical protein